MNRLDVNKTDEDLWRSVREGDKAAFNLLFSRYWGYLYQTANQLMSDAEGSETIVHDIFLNLWLKRDSLEILQFRNYITSATRYHVYKALKAKKSVQVVEPVEHMAFTMNMAEEKISEQSFRSQVQASVGNLPKRCKEIFLLSREEQLSNQEIADRLNISKRSVENQITHALQQLRLHLKHLLMGAALLATWL